MADNSQAPKSRLPYSQFDYLYIVIFIDWFVNTTTNIKCLKWAAATAQQQQQWPLANAHAHKYTPTANYCAP